MDHFSSLNILELNALQTDTYSQTGCLVRAALQQFVRQKTNSKVAAGSVHPIHHLLMLWEWNKVMVINQRTPHRT